MAIQPSDISTDEDTARRVLVRARGIAPCLDSLDGEAKQDAIAILKGVVAELPAPGTRGTRSMSRDGSSITYADIASAFSSDDIAALRSLCEATAGARAPLPIGAFPAETVSDHVWPQGRYT